MYMRVCMCMHVSMYACMCVCIHDTKLKESKSKELICERIGEMGLNMIKIYSTCYESSESVKILY